MGPLGNNPQSVSVPEVFCWTKFGDEAGECPGSIFRRKEVERQRNRGTFLWGIGQSIRPSLVQMLRITPAPRVLFSPIKSLPAPHDASPSSVVIWYEGVGLDGHPYALPKYSLVTSRRDDRLPRTHHFALVCERKSPITPREEDAPRLKSASLRNLVSGSPIGSSQVTSVVRFAGEAGQSGSDYPVVTEAQLVAPYLVRLTCGVVVPSPRKLDLLSQSDPASGIEGLLRMGQAGEPEIERVGAPTGLLW